MGKPTIQATSFHSSAKSQFQGVGNTHFPSCAAQGIVSIEVMNKPSFSFRGRSIQPSLCNHQRCLAPVPCHSLFPRSFHAFTIFPRYSVGGASNEGDVRENPTPIM